MRGNLPALGHMMAVLTEDLNYAGATIAEREAALIMSALHAAIILGKTGELAELASVWLESNRQAAISELLRRRAAGTE